MSVGRWTRRATWRTCRFARRRWYSTRWTPAQGSWWRPTSTRSTSSWSPTTSSVFTGWWSWPSRRRTWGRARCSASSRRPSSTCGPRPSVRSTCGGIRCRGTSRCRRARIKRASLFATATVGAWAASRTSSRCPLMEGFRVSSPILTDQIQADAAGEAVPKPVLVARRRFASGTTLFCQFTVYNAALVAATRQPRSAPRGSCVGPTAACVRQSESRTLTPAADGALTRLYGITLAGLTPGDYELVLLVRDELQVKTAELREPFAVERGVGVSAAPSCGASAPSSREGAGLAPSALPVGASLVTISSNRRDSFQLAERQIGSVLEPFRTRLSRARLVQETEGPSASKTWRVSAPQPERSSQLAIRPTGSMVQRH